MRGMFPTKEKDENMATYENVYSVSNFKKSTRTNAAIISTAADMTLYEARQKLIELQKADVVTDATVIRSHGRCVGFFSEWHKDVTPMFGAFKNEKYLLATWSRGGDDLPRACLV